MGIKIVTDSLSGLSPTEAAKNGIELIPHSIVFGTQTLRDGVDITPAEFLQHIETSKKLPTTSPPGVDDFTIAFRKHLQAGDQVLFIAPSSQLSGSYKNAESAQLRLNTPQLQVIDSKSFGAGQALLATTAAYLATKTSSLTGLMKHLARIIPQLQVIFYVEQLDYLAKGGRIGGLQGLLGKAMKIKPMMCVQNGVITPLSRVRSVEEGRETMLGKLREDLTIQPLGGLAVMHAGSPSLAQALLEALQVTVQEANLTPMDMPSALVQTTGRGAFGIAYFTLPPHSSGLGPDHPAYDAIDMAARAADRFIHLTALSGGHAMLEVNSQDAAQVVSQIDEALAVTPDDVDLLVAKSGALRCAMQFKTAEELLDQALALAPDHFDAKMNKAHWDTWKHPFQFPSWSSETTTLHPLMAQKLQDTHTVQLVRDGLQLGITIVRPASARDFPSGLSGSMPCKWVPVWSDTPFGPIVAHYMIVYDDPVNPYKGEGFMTLNLEHEYHPEANYWLLQRLCTSDHCYLALADGTRVLFNVRYTFPPELKATLTAILSKRAKLTSEMDSATFMRACQWHMNNFDMGNVG